jgi:hypothetical protein
LQSAVRKAPPGGGVGEAGVVGWSDGPHPASSAAVTASAAQQLDNDLAAAMVTCPIAGWR